LLSVSLVLRHRHTVMESMVVIVRLWWCDRFISDRNCLWQLTPRTCSSTYRRAHWSHQ